MRARASYRSRTFERHHFDLRVKLVIHRNGRPDVIHGRTHDLSFSGIVSFKNADDLRAAAAITPENRLLIETYSPYLAPEPYRGQTNEPGYVPFVGAARRRAERKSTFDWSVAGVWTVSFSRFG